jgi:putative transposase
LLGESDELIAEHDLYRRLGMDEAARCKAYRGLFRSALETAEIDEIRAATNKGWALGNDRFRAEMAALAQRRAGPLARGRPKKETTEE